MSSAASLRVREQCSGVRRFGPVPGPSQMLSHRTSNSKDATRQTKR
ncbi:hypothetical protein [Streptomyces albogriseolus]